MARMFLFRSSSVLFCCPTLDPYKYKPTYFYANDFGPLKSHLINVTCFYFTGLGTFVTQQWSGLYSASLWDKKRKNP